MKKIALVVMIVLFSVLFVFSASYAKPFKIAAIFQTAIEEPWDGVIHLACLKKHILRCEPQIVITNGIGTEKHLSFKDMGIHCQDNGAVLAT